MQGRELARGCKGVFIIAFYEWGSTSPRIGIGDVLKVLIVAENASIVPVSTRREEGRKLSLKEMLEGGMLEVCRTLKGNTWQGANGLGGKLWKCEGSCCLARS